MSTRRLATCDVFAIVFLGTFRTFLNAVVITHIDLCFMCMYVLVLLTHIQIYFFLFIK